MIVEYTKVALDGLNDILFYINSKFGYALSIEIEGRILSSIDRLENIPYMGYATHHKKWGSVRILVIQSLTIVTYQIKEDSQKIIILDIFDARINWKK